jgi:hypothetical protein
MLNIKNAISGRIRSELSGDPVHGLSVIARPNHSAGSTPWGNSITDTNGRFALTAPSNPEALKQWVLAAANVQPFALDVLDGKGNILHSIDVGTPDAPDNGKPLDVALPPPSKGDIAWLDIGAVLQKKRIETLRGVVRYLRDSGNDNGGAQKLADDAAVAQLEQAFLDPSGTLAGLTPSFAVLRDPEGFKAALARITPLLGDEKVRTAWQEMLQKVNSFDDVSQVDIPVDVTLIQQGALDQAVNMRPLGSLGDLLDGPEPALDPQPSDADLVQYRDYLRAIWLQVWTITHPVDDLATPDQVRAATFDVPIGALADRFGQDFTTTDTAQEPANTICARVLTRILTAASDHYGFGLPAASIPVQGRASNREYLDSLIAITRLGRSELETRYRIDLSRGDAEQSSEVWENCVTLQCFFRDNFQAPPEPRPIIPAGWLGRAPFFLELKEWLRTNGPFWPENVYPAAIPTTDSVTPDEIARLGVEIRPGETYLDPQDTSGYNVTATIRQDESDAWQWYLRVLELERAIAEGNAAFDLNDFGTAGERFGAATTMVEALVNELSGIAYTVDDRTGEVALADDIFATLRDLRRRAITSVAELRNFIVARGVDESSRWLNLPNNPQGTRVQALLWRNLWEQRRSAVRCYALYLALFVLPLRRGDTAFSSGAYDEAVAEFSRVTRFLVARAELAAPGPYLVEQQERPRLFRAGELPYTVDLNEAADAQFGLPDTGSFQNASILDRIAAIVFQDAGGRTLLHTAEIRTARLRQSEAMLAWADDLYRTDDPALIRRARELYKGVLWLNGVTPPGIAADWTSFGFPPLPDPLGGLFGARVNPAVASVIMRAHRRIDQIDGHLNCLGYPRDLVPPQRYQMLRLLAQSHAASAVAVQSEFVAAQEAYQQAEMDRIRESATLNRALLNAHAKSQEAGIATLEGDTADRRIAAVLDRIASIQREIDDSQTLAGQIRDGISAFFGESGPSEDSLSRYVPISGLASGAEGAGVGLAAGLGVVGAFAYFVYKGYTTLNKMVEDNNHRVSEIQDLRDNDLRTAQDAAGVSHLRLAIAQTEEHIANADAALATELLLFGRESFLNRELWARFAALLRRVLARYLDMGARAAWLAERAYVFESGRESSIIRFDYGSLAVRGVGAADLLSSDLSRLEDERVRSLQSSVPMRHTISLRGEYPVQYARLRRTGRCTFSTSDAGLRLAYPGAYGHRIQAVTVSVTAPGAQTVRGVLSSNGLSRTSREDGTMRTVVAQPAGMPVSEFDILQHAQLYGLPGATLMSFEGSGFESAWTLEFPPLGNPLPFSQLGDVVVTFDMTARYSEALRQASTAAPATLVRTVVVSADRTRPQLMEDLRAGRRVTVPFDFRAAGLPVGETNRRIDGIALAAGGTGGSALLQFAAEDPAGPVDVQLVNAVAYSRFGDEVEGSNPALTTYVGSRVEQLFQVTIDPARNGGTDFSGIADLLLMLRYECQTA